MKKNILKLLAILFATTILLCGCEQDQQLTPTKEFYVNDFAQILTVEDSSAIQSAATTLYNSTTAQIVVVTVESLNGEEISQLALEIGRDWGVGSKEENNGIVVLLSVEERNIYIAVGYGLEGALPDSKTGRIIDRYGLEYLKNNDFSTGIREIVGALINEVYIEYGQEPQAGYVSIDNLPDEEGSSTGEVSLSWIIMIIIVLCVVIIPKKRGGFIYMGGGPRFGGEGFGGSGGGFSGGGGSFGGGGAGRSF